MNDKQEFSLGIIAAVFVLFTAMIAPPVSAALALLLLVVFAIYKFRQGHKASG